MKILSIAILVVFLSLTPLGGQNPAQPDLESPSAVLQKEHKVILLVANSLRPDLQKLREGKAVDPARLEMALDFFVNFADACHHRKEEEHYFPAAESAGSLPQHVQISEFLSEHQYYRHLLDKIREGISEDKVSPDVAMPLATYLASVTSHIRKENQILFKETRPWLSKSTNKRLIKKFQELESSLGENFHQKYHDIAMELSGR